MTYLRLDGEGGWTHRIEKPHTGMTIWVEDDEDEIVERQVSLSSRAARSVSPSQMAEWGWTKVVEENHMPWRPQQSSEIEIIDGTPTRTWENLPWLHLEGPDTIPADSETSTLVVYEGPGETVTFDVNGATQEVEVVEHRAELEVAASAPGPVEVRVQGHSSVVMIDAVSEVAS